MKNYPTKITIFMLMFALLMAPLPGFAALAPVQDTNKITLDLKGMDVIEVIKMLATKGNLNIVIGSNVKGRVTIFLKSVDVMDAFEIILIANDLAYETRGSIIYVMTQREYESTYGERYADKKEVRVFQLKYAKAVEVSKALNQIKTKLGKVVVDEGSNTVVAIDSPLSIQQMAETVSAVDIPTVIKIFDLQYAKAADLKAKVQESLTKGIGTMQIDERTNKIVVTDIEKKMAEVSEMIAAFDDKYQQVLIEAKIVQITLSDKYQLGVDWDGVMKKLSKEISIKSAFQVTAANALVPGGQIIIGALGASDYAVMIQMLKEIGDTNLLSSPRITAINNQEAKILIGTSQPYATNTVTQGTSTTTTATNLSFIDIGVKLYVTPTINQDGFITMKIKPEVSSSTDKYTYGDPATTVPIVSTTQAETSVIVKDGTTIIIAGLVKDERSNTLDKIPFLGDVPLLGHAFSRTDNRVQKQELVIFLTPHIVSGDVDYIKNPKTYPMGDKGGFTLDEKPAFEQRNDYPIDPNYFKEDKKPPTKEDWLHFFKGNKSSSAGLSAEGYYDSLKRKVIGNIELPKAKKVPKGGASVVFTISPEGTLVGEPDIVRASNKELGSMAAAAVEKSSPFPAFPDTMGRKDQRFAVDVVFE